MTTAVEFKRCASACLTVAQNVSSDDQRKLLLDMAKTWTALAAEQEGTIIWAPTLEDMPPAMRGRLH